MTPSKNDVECRWTSKIKQEKENKENVPADPPDQLFGQTIVIIKPIAICTQQIIKTSEPFRQTNTCLPQPNFASVAILSTLNEEKH